MTMKSERPDAGMRVLGRGRHRGRTLRLPLAEVRQAVGYSQRDVTGVAGIDQGDISRLERQTSFDRVEVATLRRYVEALGGKLELVAVFPKGHRIALAPDDGAE